MRSRKKSQRGTFQRSAAGRVKKAALPSQDSDGGVPDTGPEPALRRRSSGPVGRVARRRSSCHPEGRSLRLLRPGGRPGPAPTPDPADSPGASAFRLFSCGPNEWPWSRPLPPRGSLTEAPGCHSGGRHRLRPFAGVQCCTAVMSGTRPGPWASRRQAAGCGASQALPSSPSLLIGPLNERQGSGIPALISGTAPACA
ncbi:hypothetical protein ANANG_G00209350 [Anguilla anguilla]|uniref:Uncharacterized protein n=1 Tax=Anguilla anguilla TaxID=7936 RepID=A0A9D3M6S0_ANGAN|nr:hypothetical protein ANANG_G00209350 [Anguilla anguilla]